MFVFLACPINKIKELMKKLLPLLVLLISITTAVKLYAQPTVYLDANFVLVDSGQSDCIQFRTLDFTDIQEMKFSVRWDPDVISSPVVNNILPALDNGTTSLNIVIDEVEGYMTFDWKINQDPGCPPNTESLTLADHTVLFDFCFTGEAGHTYITMGDDPLESYVTRANACPLNIGLFTDEGFIAVKYLPVFVNVPDLTAYEGETVCMDFTVENFVDIVSMQFSVNWLPQVLQFESYTCLLPNCGPNNINVNNTAGYMTFSWVSNDVTIGTTLPNGEAIFQLCFTVVGNCGQVSPVSITGDPIDMEITHVDGNQDPEVGVFQNGGSVTVGCINPNGLTVMVQDAQVQPAESFCLDVTVENFNNLKHFQWSMVWDDALIQFTGIQGINPNLSFFDINDFDLTGVNNGFLSVDWSVFSSGETLPDGSVLFQMCFDAVSACYNSPVSIVGDPVPIEVVNASNQDVGINTFNGLVELFCPPGITVSTPDMEVDPGSTFCMPVYVQNFDQVTNLTFTIDFVSSDFEFQGLQNFGLPGLDASNFDVSFASGGVICLNWEDLSGLGQTLPDGAVLFEMCFTAVGPPLACEVFSFGLLPCGLEVITANSAGLNVGLNPQGGEVCITNPFSFVITVPDTSGIQGQQVCMDFTVQNFINLGQTDYTIAWNADVLAYAQLIDNPNNQGFSGSSYDDSNADMGYITVNWVANGVSGVSLPNDEVLFSLCFNLIGNEGDCSAVSITGIPQAINIVPFGSNMNVGMIAQNGSVCIAQHLTVTDTLIFGPDCPGDFTGSIDISVSGGSGDYSFMWMGPGITAPNDTAEDPSGLTNDLYTVIIVDNLYQGLAIQEVYEVPLSSIAPVAFAGQDTVLQCGSPTMEISGTGSSEGAQYEYLWYPITGLVDPNTETQLTTTIFGPGEYVLQVTDNLLGCTVTDTVVVEHAVEPFAFALALEVVNCYNDTVMVSGENSSLGSNIAYQWTTTDGMIVPGTETEINAQVTSGGTYILTVTNTSSNCTNMDTVTVEMDTISPQVVITGNDQPLTCAVNSVELDGSMSSSGPEFDYYWTDPQNGFISDQLTATATEAGFYHLMVTNLINGCSAIDSVEVATDTLLPEANAGLDQFLTCVVDTVTLDGSASDQGAEFTYMWTGPGVVPGTENQIAAQAVQAGQYTLMVTNTTNDCQSLSVVQVSMDTVPPVAVAGVPDTVLTCLVLTANIDGTGSSEGAPGAFTYLWEGPEVLVGQNQLQVTVGAPGVYTLTVTQASNGCTATAETEVLADTTAPDVVIAEPGLLTCDSIFITLDASASDQGPQYTYLWSGPFCINVADPLYPVVGCTGTFTLQIINSDNGCFAEASVEVGEDNTPPTVELSDTVFTCYDDQIVVDVSGVSAGAEFSYSWTTVPQGNGCFVSDITDLNLVVCGPGGYGLEVTNTLNGCVATGLVNVIADTMPPAELSLGPDTVLTCLEPEITLQVSTTTTGNLSYSWFSDGASIPGANGNTLPVNQPAAYSVQVTNEENGCSGVVAVLVDDMTNPPLADAGPAQVDLICTEGVATLDGSNSDSGPEITYMWLTSNGLIVPGTETQAVAQADTTGLYVLQVLNQITGCVGTDSVVVNYVVPFEDAAAEVVGDPCTTSATLIGNLPEGTTGSWSINPSADIEDPTSAMTFVDNLAAGLSSVTWTLSAPGCGDFSSVTLDHFVETFPFAVNDQAFMDDQTDQVFIDALLNDNLIGVDSFSFTIPEPPSVGAIENLVDGSFTYVASPYFTGDVQFDYVVCNLVCPDFCDTAFVLIQIDKNIDLTELVPNAITPNGDGVNEALIFDILLNDPAKYPNNSLIIFNRWNDVVYEASPYLNDWQGTNQSGQPLPEGTYYYIFRLNVAEGDIIKGDITIIR